MRRYVLDANALVTLLGERPGAKRVAALVSEAQRNRSPLLMSVVNWGEVISLIWRKRGESEARRTEAAIRPLPISLCDVDAAQAWDAARLCSVHRLPYADSFAAGLALREQATLVTSDPDFARLGKQLQVLWLGSLAG